MKFKSFLSSCVVGAACTVLTGTAQAQWQNDSIPLVDVTDPINGIRYLRNAANFGTNNAPRLPRSSDKFSRVPANSFVNTWRYEGGRSMRVLMQFPSATDGGNPRAFNYVGVGINTDTQGYEDNFLPVAIGTNKLPGTIKFTYNITWNGTPTGKYNTGLNMRIYDSTTEGNPDVGLAEIHVFENYNTLPADRHAGRFYVDGSWYTLRRSINTDGETYYQSWRETKNRFEGTYTIDVRAHILAHQDTNPANNVTVGNRVLGPLVRGYYLGYMRFGTEFFVGSGDFKINSVTPVIQGRKGL